MEQQEEQRRIERKSKREEDADDDDSADDDESEGGEDDAEGGRGRIRSSGNELLDSDKAKKQDAKNAKQKVGSCFSRLCMNFSPSFPPLCPQANRKEKKKIKLRANSRAGAAGEDVVEDLEFSD